MFYQGQHFKDLSLVNGNFKPVLDASIENSFRWYKEEFELMQYTGLKDKNGVEVYEGDILQLFYGKENTPLTTTKVFFNEEGYWDSKNLSEQHPFRACYGGFNKCEVIGNIYENPELLEGEENASN